MTPSAWNDLSCCTKELTRELKLSVSECISRIDVDLLQLFKFWIYLLNFISFSLLYQLCILTGALLSGVGHQLSQHLHGELAGLLVLNNHTEADHVVQCINSCEQKLDFHAINEMETGMVSFVDSLHDFTVSAD